MAGRPGTLPWDMSTFTGSEPITRWSDNYNFLNNQINDSGVGFTSYAVDTGTQNNLVVTLPSAPLAYEAGMMVCTVPAFTNSGASVINVNSLGNVPIVNPANIALSGFEFSQNALLALVYDGTSFRIIGPCPKTIITTTSATSLTVECAGYTSVSVVVTFSGSSLLFVASHLAAGVPVNVTYVNISGASRTISMTATTPSGSAFGALNAVQAGSVNGGAFVSLISTGIGLLNSSAMSFNGVSMNGDLILNH